MLIHVGKRCYWFHFLVRKDKSFSLLLVAQVKQFLWFAIMYVLLFLWSLFLILLFWGFWFYWCLLLSSAFPLKIVRRAMTWFFWFIDMIVNLWCWFFDDNEIFVSIDVSFIKYYFPRFKILQQFLLSLEDGWLCITVNFRRHSLWFFLSPLSWKDNICIKR